MKNILFILFVLASSTSFSATLKAVTLPDQFETQTALDESTKWLVFSAEKDVSDQVNKAFEEMKITDIKFLNGIYVSDISKMPSMVTSMFALPKMKKYPFKIVLDQDGAPTSTWPKEKGKATLLVLKNLEIVSTQYESLSDGIKKFISEQQIAVSPQPVVEEPKKKSKK